MLCRNQIYHAEHMILLQIKRNIYFFFYIFLILINIFFLNFYIFSYLRKDRPPCVPTFIFLIDVSLASVQNGFLSAVIESIKDTINNDLIPHSDRVRVLIFFFNYF